MSYYNHEYNNIRFDRRKKRKDKAMFWRLMGMIILAGVIVYASVTLNIFSQVIKWVIQI